MCTPYVARGSGHSRRRTRDRDDERGASPGSQRGRSSGQNGTAWAVRPGCPGTPPPRPGHVADGSSGRGARTGGRGRAARRTRYRRRGGEVSRVGPGATQMLSNSGGSVPRRGCGAGAFRAPATAKCWADQSSCVVITPIGAANAHDVAARVILAGEGARARSYCASAVAGASGVTRKDAGILAHHGGGKGGFIALGVGGDDRQPEAVAQRLDRLVPPVFGRLIGASVGGREQGGGSLQSGSERASGGIEKGRMAAPVRGEPRLD
jgi:hypothetical protein